MKKQAIISANGAGILARALLNKSRETPDELAARHAKREREEQERVRNGQILRGVCPACAGKLTRGKKNKKLDYQREWTCASCPAVFRLGE